MYFLSDLGIVRVPPDRTCNLVAILSEFAKKSRTTARSFSFTSGVPQCCSGFCGNAQVTPPPIAVNSALPMETTVTSTACEISLGHEFHHYIRWWLMPNRFTRGVPIHDPEPQFHLIQTGSLQGWGAHIEPLATIGQGTWSLNQSQSHINLLEMKAVSLALANLLPLIRGKCVLLATDNSTVVSYIRKQGGTHSLSLFRETWDLLTFCQENGISLRVRHIPGRLNVIADRLSRGTAIPTEWEINPRITQSLFDLWGTPYLDLFSTRFNNKLPRFVSPVADHRAHAVDAFSMEWGNLFMLRLPTTKGCCNRFCEGQDDRMHRSF